MTVDVRSLPVRFSNLKLMGLSPMHYRHAALVDRPDSLAMRIGRGVHSFLLDMPDRVVEWTGKTRQGDAWKAFKAEHEAAGREILNSTEHRRALEVASAIRAEPRATSLLFGGTTMEQRLDWSFMDRACRSTPDSFGPSRLVELKTARTTEPERFVTSATFMGYHAQLSFYRSALRELGLSSADQCYIVAVESAPPYPVSVFELTERALEQGEMLWRGWFERLLVCERADEWPGYCQSNVAFDVATDLRGDGDDYDLVWPDDAQEATAQ